MIPPVPPHDIPESERRFFVKLAGEPGTEDWTALHSLGLSSRYTGHFGEIDFVILIPGKGIVCIEVKGGGVSQRNGNWTSRDRHGKTHDLKRSPWAQAQSAMFKLTKAVEEQFGKASPEARAPIGYLVVLPDVDCPPPCPEFGRGDVLDRTDIERPVAAKISGCPTLSASAAKLQRTLGPAPLINLRAFLRPDFDRVLTAGASLKPVEEALQGLTEEQYVFLDTLEYNEKCILVGPAGSGKTTLAIEYARRLAADGKSVLVLCFNRMLGDWLATVTSSGAKGNIEAGSLHRLLDARIRGSSFSGDFQKSRGHPKLFDELYPLYGAMAIDEVSERFDAVIIDEAQDFQSEMLVALAEIWTRDVDEAKVVLLGDYSQQSIYGTPGESLKTARERLGGAPIVSLRRNCRNTRRIATHTSLLSGFGEFELHARQPEGDAVETSFSKGPAEQQAKVAKILHDLNSEGISPADIVILGKYRLENSGLGSIDGSPWTVAEARLLQSTKDTVAYSTIHAFKGLESPVVILVDIDRIEEDEAESLLYVAMSRARARLYMCVSSSCRVDYDRKIMNSLRKIASV